MSNLAERLEKFAEEMKDWETRKTSVEGVEIAKLPSKGGQINLSLKIMPTDEEGKALKRKAIFVTSLEQWEELSKIFKDDKAKELMEAIEEMKNQGKTPVQDDEDKEVFEL